MTVQMSMKLSPKQTGNLYKKTMRLEDEVEALTRALNDIYSLAEAGKLECSAVRNIIKLVLNPAAVLLTASGLSDKGE